MLRLIGVIFMLAAVAAAVRDWRLSADAGRAFEISPLGDLWFALHKESLIGLQSGLENRISLEAFSAVAPVLYLPAAPLLGGIGAGLFVLGVLLRARAARR
jgi:hypothetical protein